MQPLPEIQEIIVVTLVIILTISMFVGMFIHQRIENKNLKAKEIGYDSPQYLEALKEMSGVSHFNIHISKEKLLGE